MKQFDHKLLNQLLDSYENSKLMRGENKVAVRVSYAFTPDHVPEYFDENSLAYEEIHVLLKELQDRGFLQIKWKNNKPDHIVEKVILCDQVVDAVYAYVKRVPKTNIEENALKLLMDMMAQNFSPVTKHFIDRMIQKIRQGKSVKEYMDISDTKAIRDLLYALDYTIQNQEECFEREFSIRHFHDSKRYAAFIAKVCKIIREEEPQYEMMENADILAEYQIYHTPSYVYMKGNICLKMQDQSINLNAFKQGLGFALDAHNLQLMEMKADGLIKSIYTVENLTTFFSFEANNSLILYLGGYHNRVRRELLKMVYGLFPNAIYYHFGDIDAGGFQIYYHLREKTGIPFEMYQMNLEILMAYEKYGKKLTDNDRKRLRKIRDTKMDEAGRRCVDYMLAHNVKLEQECIENGEPYRHAQYCLPKTGLDHTLCNQC